MTKEITDFAGNFWIDMDGQSLKVFSVKRRVAKDTYQPSILVEFAYTLEHAIDNKDDMVKFYEALSAQLAGEISRLNMSPAIDV